MKSATKAVCRALVDLARAADLLDPAAVHDRDPVRHRERLLLVVRDVDERRSRARAGGPSAGAASACAASRRALPAARPGAAPPAGSRARARGRRAAAGPPRAGGAAAARGPRAAPSVAAARCARGAGCAGPASPSARRRRCRRSTCAGRGRTAGTPCSPAGGLGARWSRPRPAGRSGPRRAPRSRRSSAASSSCRSRSARAARRTRRRAILRFTSSTAAARPKRLLTPSRAIAVRPDVRQSGLVRRRRARPSSGRSCRASCSARRSAPSRSRPGRPAEGLVCLPVVGRVVDDDVAGAKAVGVAECPAEIDV